MLVEVLYDYYHYNYNCYNRYCYFALNYRMSSHPAAYLSFTTLFEISENVFLYLISKSHYCILNSQNIFRCIFCLCSFTILTKTRVAQFSAACSISALVNFSLWCSRSSCLLSCLAFWCNLPLPLRGTNEDPSALSKTKQLKINQKTRKLKRCLESILNICCGQKSTGSLILNCCTVAFL